MKNFSIKSAERQRLDEFLQKKVPELIQKDVSKSKIRRMIIAGSVSVNGNQVRIPAFVVRENSKISILIDEDKLFYEKTPDDIKFDLTKKDVLFEDESIIVVNKPAFFPTEAGMVGSRDNLHAAVVRYLWSENPTLRNPPYAGIMHRLDRETSGVILFTKKRDANAPCHEMFEKHTATKIYRAVVSAEPSESKFSVKMLMGRISPKSQAAKWGKLTKDGLPSETDFSVVGNGFIGSRKVFFVECRPLTGRTHQIRVHLSSVGLPILGDELYGGKNHTRIMLHAKTLTFPHPVTGENVTVSAPLPEGFY
ncbi:RluA family pseudouridine synthase [Treponema zioleckii]|uniref:RluA family pseudouridine synthase n=1 Tax=Treponema zioleckii TaxID=331680 RepID=UPI00168BDA21|nr:RluA family pseudouridine synthase [Treponema zioleckii]